MNVSLGLLTFFVPSDESTDSCGTFEKSSSSIHFQS